MVDITVVRGKYSNMYPLDQCNFGLQSSHLGYVKILESRIMLIGDTSSQFILPYLEAFDSTYDALNVI
jgi:hypothetical protein